MEDPRGPLNLIKICTGSQSILISYNSSKYHVTVCIVHLWCIRKAIWLWLRSVSGGLSVLSSHFLCQTVLLLRRNTYFTSISASLVFSSQTSWRFSLHRPHPPTSTLHLSSPYAGRKATVGDRYLTIWWNHIFFLILSKFNLVLNIPVALIRCPR